ncbi:MAG TPA: ABC transporter ATP-binding protein [Solirubrobacteraceae bacterium]|nr:ABC transporter ATP-binding protein [Solirubrobacteraceae bacterium]
MQLLGFIDRSGAGPGDRLLLRVARDGGAWVVLLALANLAIAAAELALPAVLGSAVDALFAEGSAGIWVAWAAGLILVLVGADTLDDLASGAAIARSTARLRHGLLAHVLTLGARSRLPSGETTTRLVGNAAEAGRVAPDVVRAIVGLVPAIGGIVALAVIDPWLCATFVIGMPVLLVFVRAYARDAGGIATRYFAAQGKVAERLVDALAGARTIAVAGTVGRERQRVLAPLPELHREGVAMWRAQMRITAQDAVLVSLLEVAVLAVAGVLLAEGRISAGQMLAAAQYVLLASTIGSVAAAVTRLVRSRAAAARAAELLEQPPMRYGNQPAPPGRGQIELHGVGASVDGRPVLAGIDLVVPAGALVAIVGASGSGKSLLAALAGRLVDPDEGEVLLDGVALAQLERSALRQEVGYGFERPALIGATVADAIAFGASAPPRAEIVRAARAARADGFIRRLPSGYDTPLDKAPMSGGEAQRAGLARTFAHARRVVVLDDVAASLDSVTEHEIGAVLTGELGDRTRIVVAHRVATAARADLVVWLADGGIRARGTHDQLWAQPDYRALFGFAPGSNGDGR